MDTSKKLKLGALIEGTGWNYSSWRHPEMPSDASENIEFYVQQAKLAEDATSPITSVCLRADLSCRQLL